MAKAGGFKFEVSLGYRMRLRGRMGEYLYHNNTWHSEWTCTFQGWRPTYKQNECSGVAWGIGELEACLGHTTVV